jgi:hypothetical protein
LAERSNIALGEGHLDKRDLSGLWPIHTIQYRYIHVFLDTLDENTIEILCLVSNQINTLQKLEYSAVFTLYAN